MDREKATIALTEWGETARDNAEREIVTLMFRAASSASAPIDAFSGWLLVGTAAIASFLLGNSDHSREVLSDTGLRFVGGALTVSCLFGVLARMFSVQHTIAVETDRALQTALSTNLDLHEAEEAKIQEASKRLGIEVDSEIRFEKVLAKFLEKTPFYVRWLMSRWLTKHRDDPHAGHSQRMNALSRQAECAFAQSLTFLAFLAFGFFFASK